MTVSGIILAGRKRRLDEGEEAVHNPPLASGGGSTSHSGGAIKKGGRLSNLHFLVSTTPYKGDSPPSQQRQYFSQQSNVSSGGGVGSPLRPLSVRNSPSSDGDCDHRSAQPNVAYPSNLKGPYAPSDSFSAFSSSASFSSSSSSTSDVASDHSGDEDYNDDGEVSYSDHVSLQSSGGKSPASHVLSSSFMNESANAFGPDSSSEHSPNEPHQRTRSGNPDKHPEKEEDPFRWDPTSEHHELNVSFDECMDRLRTTTQALMALNEKESAFYVDIRARLNARLDHLARRGKAMETRKQEVKSQYSALTGGGGSKA